MKLVYWTAARPASGTAHAWYVKELATALTTVSNDVAVLAPGVWGGRTELIRESEAYGKNLPFSLQFIRCYPPARLRYFFMPLFFLFGRFSSLDSIWITHIRLFALALMLTKRRFLLDMHSEPKTGVARKLMRSMSRSSLCLGVVCSSSSKLMSVFEGIGVPRFKMRLLRNGFDDTVEIPDRTSARKRLRIDQTIQIVTYCGSLERERGLEALFNASTLLARTVRYMIVGGNNAQIRYYRDILQKCNANSGQFTFTGAVDHEAVNTYLAASDVLVALYTTRVSVMDMRAPMKLFEFMAVRRPIVAPNLPAISELVEHDRSAYLYQPQSCEDLAEGLRKCLTDTEYGKLLSDNARTAVEQFTWANKAKHMNEMIEKGLRRENGK